MWLCSTVHDTWNCMDKKPRMTSSETKDISQWIYYLPRKICETFWALLIVLGYRGIYSTCGLFIEWHAICSTRGISCEICLEWHSRGTVHFHVSCAVLLPSDPYLYTLTCVIAVYMAVLPPILWPINVHLSTLSSFLMKCTISWLIASYDISSACSLAPWLRASTATTWIDNTTNQILQFVNHFFFKWMVTMLTLTELDLTITRWTWIKVF